MAVIQMKHLLEAGVHFGHQTRRWNPKMSEYIYTERNGIHIIDLQKTSKKVEEAYAFIRQLAMDGKSILFVGTKKQAQDVVEQEARRIEQFWVSTRWLGGMLTNYKTIKKRIERLEQLERMDADGTFDLLPKKEAMGLRKEHDRLERYLGGIRNMGGLPGAIFIVDPKKEHIAITEARKLNIPVVGIVDTNCDPSDVDYVIPANDDAIRAVKLIVEALANAVVEGREARATAAAEAKADADAKAAEAKTSKPAAKPPAKKEVIKPMIMND